MSATAGMPKQGFAGRNAASIKLFLIVTASALCVAFALIIALDRELPVIFFLAVFAGAISVVLVVKESEYGLYLAFFSILLPLRIPLGGTSISCTWPAILMVFSIYLVKALTGHSPLPLGRLVPLFSPFTLFACLSLLNAHDRSHGVSKIILWCLSGLLLAVSTGIASQSKEKVRKIRDLLYYASLALGIIGILIIISGMILGAGSVVSLLFSKIYPLVRSEADVLSQVETIRRFHPMLNWTVMDGKLLRNISLFLSPIVTASFFGLVTPLALGFYLNNRSDGKWHSFVMYFGLLNILLTQTRGAFIGVIVSLTVVLAISEDVQRKVKVLAVVSLNGVFVLMFAGEIFLSRILAISRAAYVSTETRLAFMQRGFEIAMANSLTGIGFANYESYVRAPFREYPHNQFIEIWAETGLGGLIAFLAILIVLLRRNLIARRDSTTAFDRGLYTGVVGSIIFFITHSLFEDMLGAPPALLTFMIIIGIAEGNRMLKTSKPANRENAR